MLRWMVLVGLFSSCAAPALRPSATLPSVPVLGPDARTPTHLADVARGRPLVVDFFATWCEACRGGLPAMNELARNHAQGDVVVIGIDVGEERRLVERYVTAQGIGYPVYYDPELRFQDSLGVATLPLIMVFDGDGKVAHRSTRLDEETRAVIRALAATAAR